MKLMKRLLQLSVIALALTACTGGKSSRQALQEERDSLQRIVNEKDMELNDIMGSFNEVQEGIRRINEAEGRIVVADGNPENANGKEIIRENMQFIEKAMQQNREMVDKLKEKLRSSSINADKLHKTIENLQAQIESQSQRIQELEASLAEKETQIAEQGVEIGHLNESIGNITADNESKSKTLAAQEKELNKAWFVFGTKSELKDEKILTDGNVLKSGSFNKDYFTQIDIRYDKEVKLYSKSAKILSTHPDGTYSLKKDAQGQYELHITNPSKFWSVTRYLVVQVK